MYTRQQFREQRQEVLVAAMREIGFAALIAENLEAVHVPMIVREVGGTLVLEGHVSAANPFWRTAETGARALAIFQGPHAYVSPRWLQSERTTGRTVPTWSYVVVHARGGLSIVKDRGWLLAHVEELANLNEIGRELPWAVSDAPKDYVEGLLGGIVGVRMEIGSLEGVWKMLQHQPEASRLGVISGLSASDNLIDQAMAAVMQDHERTRAEPRPPEPGLSDG
jgi:transcriptional regulator